MEPESKAPHVLIFPLPAQGHVNSMLNLAQLLSLAGLNITFLNTDHERHHNATSTGCPEHTNPEEVEGSNHEEEDGIPTARTPTATFHRTVSYSLIGKHKGRCKQNATVSH